jgi:type III secretion system-like peptide-binding chaperone
LGFAMSETTFEQEETRLGENLWRLVTEGDSSNFLIVSIGDAYVQFSAGKGDKDVYCEAVSNSYLPPTRLLTFEKASRIRAMGFEEPSDGGNFSRTSDLSTREAAYELAKATCRIFSEVYDCSADSTFKYELVLE